MKNIKKITKFVAAAAFFGATVSSCSLDLLPLNEVVLENFWTNEEDVQSVVNSCYCGMQESSYINNLIIWGEVRSDNVDNGKTINKALQNLQVGNIKTTDGYTNWDGMYNVINRCNIVLNYAPQVAAKDPNYTESHLKINVAEVKAIRAMTYLTLAKTFKDIPFTLEPSIDDNQDYAIPATKFQDVIKALIDDLEEVKDDAPKKNIRANGYDSNIQSSGRITRNAMYAILAELYLWRASDADVDQATQAEAYRQCIKCCDYIINEKQQQYRNEDWESAYVTDIKKIIDTNVYEEFQIPLIAEEDGQGAETAASSLQKAKAFTSIFCNRNSFESIFEISFPETSNANEPKNGAVTDLYGGYTKESQYHNGSIQGNNNLLPQGGQLTKSYSDKELFTVTSDYRTITSFAWTDGGTFPIVKYTVSRFPSGDSRVGTAWAETKSSEVSTYYRDFNANYSNWIMYRLSEIILFRAEAEIELANLMAPVESEEPVELETVERMGSMLCAKRGADLTTQAGLFDDAFKMISCVNRRSNPQYYKDKNNYVPKASEYTTYEKLHTLLMNERRRELLFEGKRYYDLVRLSRREGDTKSFVSYISDKFGGASQAVKVKMGMMDFMYLPYNKTQIKVNPNLKQNPAYLDEEENVIN